MPVDEEKKASRLIDQILDLRKTLVDWTSRMDDAWKFPFRPAVLSKVLQSNSYKKCKYHKVYIVSMSMRGKILKLFL